MSVSKTGWPNPSFPDGFIVQRDGVLEILWPRQRGSIGLMLMFIGCCPAPLGFYGQALVNGTVAIVKGSARRRHLAYDSSRIIGYAKAPWLGYLLMAGAILIIVWLIILLPNRTTLRAERGKLRIRHSPIPLPGTELRAQDIARFERPSVSERVAPRPPPPPSSPAQSGRYELYAIDHLGKSHRLVRGLKSPEQCAWVERELRSVLGLPPSA